MEGIKYARSWFHRTSDMHNTTRDGWKAENAIHLLFGSGCKFHIFSSKWYMASESHEYIQSHVLKTWLSTLPTRYYICLCVYGNKYVCPSDPIQRQICWPTLVHVKSCYPRPPINYINQYWFIISGNLCAFQQEVFGDTNHWQVLSPRIQNPRHFPIAQGYESHSVAHCQTLIISAKSWGAISIWPKRHFAGIHDATNLAAPSEVPLRHPVSILLALLRGIAKTNVALMWKLIIRLLSHLQQHYRAKINEDHLSITCYDMETLSALLSLRNAEFDAFRLKQLLSKRDVSDLRNHGALVTTLCRWISNKTHLWLTCFKQNFHLPA